MTVGKQRTIIFLIIFFILLALTGRWLYNNGSLYNLGILPVNYLIPGVPYNGIQNLFFFEEVNSSAIASVMDILGYWGDERFDIPALKEKLKQPSFPQDSYQEPYIVIQKFFEENGYEIYKWGSADPGNEINEIKKFVNPVKKYP